MKRTAKTTMLIAILGILLAGSPRKAAAMDTGSVVAATVDAFMDYITLPVDRPVGEPSTPQPPPPPPPPAPSSKK